MKDHGSNGPRPPHSEGTCQKEWRGAQARGEFRSSQTSGLTAMTQDIDF